MNWNIFPAVYVATVKGSGRIETVKKELDRVGLKNYFLNEQIPPIEKSFENITLSCTDNHQTIYRRALEQKYPYICVFEDDVYFEQLPFDKIYKFIETSGWDILYLGHFPWKIGDKLKKHPGIYKSYSWCTHAYVISKSGMEKMLKHTPTQMMEIARIGVPVIANMVFKECGGIDTYMAYQSYRGNLATYCLYPMVVFQYSISGWKTKAQTAELAAIKLGFWVKQIGYIGWFASWFVLVLVILLIRKNR